MDIEMQVFSINRELNYNQRSKCNMARIKFQIILRKLKKKSTIN